MRAEVAQDREGFGPRLTCLADLTLAEQDLAEAEESFAFSAPVIKSLAVASGTGKAAKSFRRRRGS